MKNIKYALVAIICAMIAMSCKKDFLQRVPQTDITEASFFKTPQDLETYSNSFYSQLTAPYDDIGSDNNSTYIAGGEVTNLLNGSLSPATVGGWDDWGDLRTLNYLLDHIGTVQGDSVDINHYVGIARFFRALFYFNKVKRYSDVPWYNHAMSNVDSSLYKAADPRVVVMDSVLNDLEFAVAHIKETEGDRTRVSKWSALALMSRICLFEGTYRKYHSELGLQSDYTKFLEKAVWASRQLMESGRFEISGNGAKGYQALFSSASLNGNKEMIQWRASDKSLGVANNTHTVFAYQWGLSKSLEETYLMKDGSRFTDQPDYQQKIFTEIFNNRDPRMSETMGYPGYSPTNNNQYAIPTPNLGGYNQLKFYPRDPALRGGWVLDYTSLPIFRFGEVLLNEIEALVELGGNIQQSDLDETVNLLRDRVNMPHMQLATANNNIDPILSAYYPKVSGTYKGLILEIRRERRVELACEGLRFDDLQRWYAGKRIEDPQQGMYVPALGGLDMTGDAIADIAILPSPSDSSAIADLPANVKARLARFYLKNADGTLNNFYLTNGTSGNIAFTADRNGARKFIEPQYYYRPIPLTQTVLNKSLKQPFGW